MEKAYIAYLEPVAIDNRMAAVIIPADWETPTKDNLPARDTILWDNEGYEIVAVEETTMEEALKHDPYTIG